MESKTPMRIAELKTYLARLESGAAIRDSFVSHMNEINILCLEGLVPFIQTVTLHYTAESLIHEFTFVDGKKYRIQIKEIK